MKREIIASIIIVHWNTPRELGVQLSKLKPSNELEIIVVDNASEQTEELLSCFELLERRQIKIIRNKTNLGFAGACNQGAKNAKGEWLLFLNPDTHITSSDILKFIENAEVQQFDAACLNPASGNYLKPLPSALSLLAEFSPFCRFIPLRLFRQKTLFGGGLLIKKSVLKKLGGWDEDFFLWFEDSDLTKRLLDEGYKIGWIEVPHNHAGGVSFKGLKEQQRRELFFASMNLYAQKHFGYFGKFAVKFLTVLNTR